jgi:hypothetical protein
MLTFYDLENLARQRQATLRAEAAAYGATRPLPRNGARRTLAAALAALARRIDPAVWERQIAKLQLPTGDAG